ncbi:Uncharacterised protein [Bordetella pertussis]|nr:Uncharacterised protein [Bordetella pertussis]
MPRSAALRATGSESRPQSAQTNMPACGSCGTDSPSCCRAWMLRRRASLTRARTRSMWRWYCPSTSTRCTTRSPSSGEVSPASIFRSVRRCSVSAPAAI